ncbi:hypothetical protein G6F63_014102 [Rhizopus arrhizus]|nr:hypothetical protein G6F63_014102 [Rhizopus arrhizus]
MLEAGVMPADGGDDVAFHDLHVIDVVEQAEVVRAEPLAQLHTPSGVVAQVVVMIDPGVQQLHHQHHAALLGMAEDALESRLGIGHAVLRVHAVAVAGEADEIAIAGIGDQIDVPRVALHQLIVELAASKALGQAQLCAVAHRAVHVMGLQRLPVLRADQVDGGEADVLHRAAELGHRQLREGRCRRQPQGATHRAA